MSEPVRIVPYDPGWSAAFASERTRIIDALGELTEGGLVEAVEHIGSTAVPGLAAKPCIDMLMSVWPVPLPKEAVKKLEGLGYVYRGENGIPGREYFQRGPHEFHLHVVSGDSDFRVDHRLFRDYLRAKPNALLEYEQLKRGLADEFESERQLYQEGKAPHIARLLSQARDWYRDEVAFAPLLEVVSELADLAVPWLVSSGWAIDLHLGKVTRVHMDVDIVVYREDQQEVHSHMERLGWRFVAPDRGMLPPWRSGEYLAPPRHQVHAHRDDKFVDFLFADRSAGQWIFRREPSITRSPERLALRSALGIPYLAPEVVLLFKSVDTPALARGVSRQDALRAKDQRDFESILTFGLEPERREWLRRSLDEYVPGRWPVL